MIKVSIIVPVFNAERFLQNCIESIVNQSLREIEIILIDDGSTDRSADICKKFLSDKRIVYVRKENEGAYAARQDGINMSHGEYIGFVDADDWIEPDMYEKMYLSANNECADIVMCGVYGDNEKMFPLSIAPGVYKDESIKREVLPNVLSVITKEKCDYAVETWTMWSKLFKKDFLINSNIHIDRQLRRGQDLVLVIESLLAAKTVVSICDEYLYHWITEYNYASVSRSYNKNVVQVYKPLIDKLYNILNIENDLLFLQNYCTCVFFLGSIMVKNEWVYSYSRKKKMIKKLEEIINEDKIKFALQYVPKEKLSKNYQSDYDVLICENGAEMYKALKQHSLYRTFRKSMRLKAKYSKYKAFRILYPKIRKKMIGMIKGRK